MHAPPPFQITLRRTGGWRFGCAALVAIPLLVTLAWAESALLVHPFWLVVSFVSWACASLGVLRHAWRLEPVSLRWDGEQWHLGPAETRGQEPLAGRLQVALDFGGWMLLRFESVSKVRWLPAQRFGHEAAWHGFRATVYCARPVSQLPLAPF